MNDDELLKLASDEMKPAILSVMGKMRDNQVDRNIGLMAIATQLLTVALVLLREIGGSRLESAILYHHANKAAAQNREGKTK